MRTRKQSNKRNEDFCAAHAESKIRRAHSFIREKYPLEQKNVTSGEMLEKAEVKEQMKRKVLQIVIEQHKSFDEMRDYLTALGLNESLLLITSMSRL